MKTVAALLIAIMIGSTLAAAEKAFSPTSPGSFEIKELPAGRLLEAKSDKSYFSRSNNLFGPLFRYISKNDIAMTTPVLADIDPGKMYFWVAEKEVDKAKLDTEQVSVVDVPRQTVVAAGFRGGYNRNNYESAKKELMNWLAERPEIQTNGEPYAVFWNSPMMPPFLKTFEIHVRVNAGE